MEKHEIKRILVPVDFSETSDTATTNAMMLAKLLKADVFLISVIEHSWFHYAMLMETHATPIILPDIDSAVTKKMNKIVEKMSKKFGIKPHVYIATGHVYKEILSFSEDNKIDLIIMGTHGVSGYNEMFLGSTAQRIVHLSEVPVLTMRNKFNNPIFKNILIPIDNSMHSREKVNIAITFGHLFGATMHIIGLPDSKEKIELNKFHIKIKSVEEILSESKLPQKTTIVHGENLAKSAIDYATKNKCDLIVINTGHESEITGIFMGAFAQQMVNHTKIPVLSIKHSKSDYWSGTTGAPI